MVIRNSFFEKLPVCVCVLTIPVCLCTRVCNGPFNLLVLVFRMTILVRHRSLAFVSPFKLDTHETLCLLSLPHSVPTSYPAPLVCLMTFQCVRIHIKFLPLIELMYFMYCTPTSISSLCMCVYSEYIQEHYIMHVLCTYICTLRNDNEL